METIDKIPVSFTEGAIAEIKKLRKDLNLADDKYLRIGVKGGGCSGMTYILDFENKSEKDEYFEIEGVPCIMNPAHAMYLSDMEIHWEGGLNSRGFTFSNPNASTTCGCGSSFGV
ncbi:iron-sulfur cluster assembly accessory protein [soil metagenome]